MQIALCDKKWCDFVIWFPQSMSGELIDFDRLFWRDVEVRLQNFYKLIVIPKKIRDACAHSLPQFKLNKPCIE